MHLILKKHSIKGPIEELFPRLQTPKKNTPNYKMSAVIPKIKIETEDSARPKVQLKNPTSIKGIDIVRDDDSVSSGSTIEQSPIKKPKVKSKSSKFSADDFQNFVNSSKVKSKKEESDKDSDEESESDDSCSVSVDSESDSESDTSSIDNKVDKKKTKQEILIKLMSLEKKGIELTKKFSMSSKLSDLQFELDMHTKQAEIDVSIKFQQKVLMAAVTGLEFANKRFDPLGAKLEGWSESVMDNLDDYDAVFAKLYEKYKERADLPPELHLLVTLAGSAFMFHVTKSLFASSLPRGIESTQASEIMKNISKAMQAGNSEISGPSTNLSSLLNQGRSSARAHFEEDSSIGSVETSKEVTINAKGKKAINL
tara:strand:+ start:12050 stop:13153 length:1104 start_codon:yes stop_codon:yes gene_type:complete